MDLPVYIEFVHHDDRVPDEAYDRLVEELDLEKLSQRLADYRFPLYLKISISRPSDDQYRAAVWFRLGKEKVHFTVGADSLEALAEALAHHLERQAAERIRTQKRRHRRQYHQQTAETLQAYCALLEQYADEGRQADFILLLSGLLDGLRGYVARKLLDAYHRGRLISPDAVDVDELLHDVFETVYRNFRRRPADQDLLDWIYSLIDRRIEQHIEKANESRIVHVTLEDIAAAELEDLNEFPLVVDAEGELYELDDFYEVVENPYYRLYSYDDFWPLDADRPEEIDPHKLHVWVANKLARLSERQRDIFDLYALEGMTTEQIARRFDIPKEEVEKTVDEVRRYLQHELEKEWKKPTPTPS